MPATFPPAAPSVALLLLATLAAASCGGGGSSGSGAPDMRIVNAITDANSSAVSNFDVLVNSVSAVTDIGPAQASAFQAIGTGTTSVEFEPTGLQPPGTTANLLTTNVSASNGFDYSVLAEEGTAGLASLVVAQTNAAVPTGQARLSFVGAAPGVSALDLFITGPAAPLPNLPSLAPLSYAGDNSAPAPAALLLPGGSYRVRAIADGDAARTIVFDSGPTTFASGVDLLLAVVPVSGSAAQFSLLTVAADSSIYQMTDQRVQFRVGNFAPATGTVDAYLNGNAAVNSPATLFASGIVPQGVSAYQAVLPGAYRASFTKTGQTAELVGSPLALVAGTSVSVFAVGMAGQSTPPYNLQVLALRDNLHAPMAGMANLRVVALAPDLFATPVDVVLLDSASSPPTISRTIVGNLAYTGASTYVPMAPGTYTIALVPTGQLTPLLPTNNGTALSLTAGTVVTLAIAGCRYPGVAPCGGGTVPLQLVPIQDL